MLKRVMVVAVAVGALAVTPVAGAATKKKHKATNHNVTLTVVTSNIQPLSLSPGRNVFAGISDGTVGSLASHASLRGVINVTVGQPSGNTVPASFTGTLTTADPNGSITTTLTGTGSADSKSGAVSFTGTAKVVKGTGTYKGATGTLSFKGGAQPQTDSDGDTDLAVDTFTTTGTLKF